MSFLNRFLDGNPQDDTVASVVRNLRHLLNAKTGYSSPLCGFGLADFHARPGGKAAAESVMREVLRDIAAYEPRLVPLHIRMLKDGQKPLAFELRGELRCNRGRPLAPRYEITPCRLGILFDPLHGEVAVYPLEESHADATRR